MAPEFVATNLVDRSAAGPRSSSTFRTQRCPRREVNMLGPRLPIGTLLCVCACASPPTSTPPTSSTSGASESVTATDRPQASMPDDKTTKSDLAKMLRAMDEQAMKRSGFTATYRFQSTEESGTVRLVYLAPDRARIELRQESNSITSWFIDSDMTMRAEEDGIPVVAHIPYKEFGLSWAGANDVLDAAFPKASDGGEALPDLGAGPYFSIKVESDPNDPEHGQWSASIGWLEHRDSFLTWLRPSAPPDHVRVDDEKRLILERGATRATISPSSGLIERFTVGDEFDARLVEYHDGADRREFDIPEPMPGAKDITVAMITDADVNYWKAARQYAYRRIVPAARSTDLASIEFRRRVESVFQAIDRIYATRLRATEGSNWPADIGRFCDSFESHWRDTASNPAQREQLTREASEWRATFVTTLTSARARMLAKIRDVAVDLKGVSDGQALELIELIERKTADAAFDEEITTPLLRQLDEHLQAIRKG